MAFMYRNLICFAGITLLNLFTVATAQTILNSPAANYQQVNTYVNPVLPGDHPDPTMLRVGNDFYHCGSSFHFTPYLPIYHSTDMVHWQVISRVVTPSNATWVTDSPGAGIWQGAITYFYGSYWIYFSANGQWFSKASSPYGPWAAAVPVKTNPQTGSLGYDNSIFVDDDGKPYMIIKNGQKVNRIQALGFDGQLADTVINLDWINARLQYSWAEGPVMSKHNGFYYYFPAGDVSGGQYVLRAKSLASDSTQWERLGDFFKPITDVNAGFRRPNHISAPLQLADGTWWTIGQSYEKYENDDWSGKGRQTSLYPVIWEGGRPWGLAPTTAPITKPNLPRSGISWRSVTSDFFEKDSLDLCWHFLTKKDATHFSLNARKGWIRLTPDTGSTSLVQKETDKYYSAVTKVEFNATDTVAKAGLYLTNGNQKVFAQLYSGYNNNSKQIVLQFDTAVRIVPNTFGNTVWLKIERDKHSLTGFCSADGVRWISMGAPVSLVNLDKVQPNYNSWVGTSIGVFTAGRPADFDFFICKDGSSLMQAAGFSNYYGVQKVTGKNNIQYVTNTSEEGGWMMISGVSLSKNNAWVEVIAAATKAGKIEIWLDGLKDGTLVATMPVAVTKNKNSWKANIGALKNVSGHHDVFIKFPAANNQGIFIKTIRFLPK